MTLVSRCFLAFLSTCVAPLLPVGALRAQRSDSVKVVLPTSRTDSLARTGLIGGPARIGAPRKPPLTPRRAFVYSMLLPGFGQSRLDRGTSGALFALVEVGSWAMVRKSRTDLREARRYSGDTLPNNYVVSATGTLTPAGSLPNRFPVELVNTRRLHVEDWLAAIAFNHLISGADAFVSAQLWDVGPRVAITPSRDGVAVVATLHW